MYQQRLPEIKIYIQYWSVDEAEKRAFSESFSPFRAESNTFYIYCQQTNIVFILQSTMS